MKPIFFAVAITGIFSFSACVGQDIKQNEVPSVVVNALAAKFPTAAKIEWEKQKEQYEAEFEIDTKEHTVLLNAAGDVAQTKYDMAETDLPEAIKTTLGTNYKDKKIDDVELLEKDGKQYYQIELEAMLKDTKLVFDASGNEQKNIAYCE